MRCYFERRINTDVNEMNHVRGGWALGGGASGDVGAVAGGHLRQRAGADRDRAQQGPAQLDQRLPGEPGAGRPARHPHLPAHRLHRTVRHARRLVPRRNHV